VCPGRRDPGQDRTFLNLSTPAVRHGGLARAKGTPIDAHARRPPHW
jgi:hypothetical protein